MSYTHEDVDRARKIADAAHEGQKRRDGSPYFTHVERVASKVNGIPEKIVAYLHDVVEDTDISQHDIAEWFGVDVCRAVDALTHRQDEFYDLYLARVCANELAMTVKRADIEDNLSDAPGKKADTYRLALYFLSNYKGPRVEPQWLHYIHKRDGSTHLVNASQTCVWSPLGDILYVLDHDGSTAFVLRAVDIVRLHSAERRELLKLSFGVAAGTLRMEEKTLP